MNKAILILAAILLLAVSIVIAAPQPSTAPVEKGLSFVFGGIADFLSNQTATFGLMFFLLFLLLFGVFSTALKKTPLFGGKDAPLDRAGKVVALSLSGIVLLSAFFGRKSIMAFAQQLAGAMNGLFAFFISGLVFLAIKYSFAPQNYGEVAGTKWEDIIAFSGFAFSLFMFSTLMDNQTLKLSTIGVATIAIPIMVIWIFMKDRKGSSDAPSARAHRIEHEMRELEDVRKKVNAAKQAVNEAKGSSAKVRNAVKRAVEAEEAASKKLQAMTPEQKNEAVKEIEAILNELNSACRGDNANLVRLKNLFRDLKDNKIGGIRFHPGNLGFLKKKIETNEKKLAKLQVTAVKTPEIEQAIQTQKRNIDSLKRTKAEFENSIPEVNDIGKKLEWCEEAVDRIKKGCNGLEKIAKTILKSPEKQEGLEAEKKKIESELLKLDNAKLNLFAEIEKQSFDLVSKIEKILEAQVQFLSKEEKQLLVSAEKFSEVLQSVVNLAASRSDSARAKAGANLIDLSLEDPNAFKEVVRVLAAKGANLFASKGVQSFGFGHILSIRGEHKIELAGGQVLDLEELKRQKATLKIKL